MMDLIENLKVLANNFQTKIDEAEKLKEEYLIKKADQDVFGAELFEKARTLSKVEKNYKKYDAFEAKENELSDRKHAVAEREADLKDKEESLSYDRKCLEEKREQLVKEQAAFSVKIKLIKEREGVLIIKEKNVQDLISGKSLSGLK